MLGDKDWTFGCEHELADWDRARGIPDGCDLDLRDVTMVNSNGIAVDPRGELYPYGGELRTRPTSSPRGQVEILREFLALHPDATVNYRSNLHVHVRVPRLGNDLERLKYLANFNDLWLRSKGLLDLIEPIPEPLRAEYTSHAEYEGARRRYRRRRKSHHTVLTHDRVRRQMKARTVQEFHDLGVPQNRGGRPMPHAQARCAVNLRQLLETDTIEFRHFPGTLDDDELLTAVEWCRDYLTAAFIAPVSLCVLFEHNYQRRAWPRFRPYVHWMEQRFAATVRGSAPEEELRANIATFLKEDHERLAR